MPNYTQKGFSLLGVIIAIFITTVGLVTILSLANISLKAASSSRVKLIASGLAQEGVEVIRGMRRSQTYWDDWYGAISDGDYLLEYNSSNLMAFSETPLKLDISSGLYQYGSGDNSPFYRKITLEQISADEVKIVVEIKWQTKGQWHNLTVEDRLWNWK